MYYCYAWLREDGTPYYIGKGKGNRAYVRQRKKNSARPPQDRSRILFLKKDLTEEEALKFEVYMIFLYGRKDNGTGILHNHSDGGEGTSGFKWTEEQYAPIRLANQQPRSEEHRRNISEGLKRAYREGKRKGKCSEETKEKISKTLTGRNKYNDGLTNQQRYAMRNKDKVRARAREWARKNYDYDPDKYRVSE